jgi:toxin CptA
MMQFVFMPLALAIAAILAATMGFAIQRGATCTVAAMDEVLTQRRANRLVALMEASFWVLAGFLGLRLLGYGPAMPAGYALGYQTVLGAALLGLGATVNGACVFGAVARFGSGQWAYAATPLGFYLACLASTAMPAFMSAQELATAAPALSAPMWLVLLMLALLSGRLLWPLTTLRGGVPFRVSGFMQWMGKGGGRRMPQRS